MEMFPKFQTRSLHVMSYTVISLTSGFISNETHVVRTPKEEDHLLKDHFYSLFIAVTET